MNQLMFLTNILLINCAVLCAADNIPVAVHSRRDFGIETINTPYRSDDTPYRSHVFEIEPSSAPLKLVFSSESSPLELAVEKAFRVGAPDSKVDRSGAAHPNRVPVQQAIPHNAGAINDDEYMIVDSYERYIPVKIRGQGYEQGPGLGLGSVDRAVVVDAPSSKPSNVFHVGRTNTKKVKVPVIKSEKLTTAKPTKRVTTTVPTTEAPNTEIIDLKAEEEETPTTTGTPTTAKFGARISRHTKSQKSSKKSAKTTKKAEKKKDLV